MPTAMLSEASFSTSLDDCGAERPVHDRDRSGRRVTGRRGGRRLQPLDAAARPPDAAARAAGHRPLLGSGVPTAAWPASAGSARGVFRLLPGCDVCGAGEVRDYSFRPMSLPPPSLFFAELCSIWML